MKMFYNYLYIVNKTIVSFFNLIYFESSDSIIQQFIIRLFDYINLLDLQLSTIVFTVGIIGAYRFKNRVTYTQC